MKLQQNGLRIIVWSVLLTRMYVPASGTVLSVRVMANLEGETGMELASLGGMEAGFGGCIA